MTNWQIKDITPGKSMGEEPFGPRRSIFAVA